MLAATPSKNASFPGLASDRTMNRRGPEAGQVIRRREGTDPLGDDAPVASRDGGFPSHRGPRLSGEDPPTPEDLSKNGDATAVGMILPAPAGG